MLAVNLIPHHRIVAGHRRRRMRRWGAAVAGWGLFLAMGYAVCLALVAGEAGLAEDMERWNRRIAAAAVRSASLSTELAHAQRRYEASRFVQSQTDWSLLPALVASELRGQVMLERCQVDTHETNVVVRLEGLARMPADVSQFVLRIERMGVFDSVRLQDTARDTALGEPLIRFRVQAVFDGGGVR